MTYRLIIGCLALAIHIFFNSNAATVDISSEHFKLAVGQGECSTTISTINIPAVKNSYKVAVTADIGSSSLRADPKYLSGYNYDNFAPLLERRNVIVDREDFFEANSGEPEKRRPPRIESDKSRSPSLRGSQLEQSDKKTTTTSLTGESTFEGSFDFLIKHLQDINLWIVFLSHPDKDHINWLKTVFNKLTETVKLILIAGGEWFNTNSTEDIRDVLSLVYTSPNRIYPFFPYQEGVISGKDMQDWLHEKGRNITKDPNSFCPRKDFNGVRLDQFHGTLIELFDTVCKVKIFDFIGLPDEDARIEALTDKILKKIYIWSLDNPIGNTNAQSIVWSHEVDDIGWTFVYTGDAENSTFKKISESIKSPDITEVPKDIIRRKRTAETGVPNLIMMLGMHHGSLENVSSLAMELFYPNAIAFSSGNGASFAHPSMPAIQKYQEFFNDPKNSLLTSSLWSSYTLRNQSYLFAAFLQKGAGSLGNAIGIKIARNKPVFLCTNTYGTLKINKSGIYTPFNETEGYLGYYDLHAYETEGELKSFKTLLTSNNVKMSNLTSAHNESYQQESFRHDLKDVSSPISLGKDQGASLIIEVNQNYALKAIQKICKESSKDKNYVYFYVLRKLSSTDTKIVPAAEVE